MTYDVDWEPPALGLAARYLAEDPAGLELILDTVDSLAQNPRPDDALPLAGSALYRLRLGRYRVVYEVDEATRKVTVLHVGRRA